MRRGGWEREGGGWLRGRAGSWRAWRFWSAKPFGRVLWRNPGARMPSRKDDREFTCRIITEARGIASSQLERLLWQMVLSGLKPSLCPKGAERAGATGLGTVVPAGERRRACSGSFPHQHEPEAQLLLAASHLGPATAHMAFYPRGR